MAFAKIRPIPSECAMNAVIYARYSSDKQTENSIDFQLRADQAYCDAKGLRVVGEYIDRAVSGTTDNRPEFQRMIRDAKKQQFAFVVVYRFDRFARNRYDSAIYKKQLEAYGVRVLSTEESIGTGDEGLILESIYEAMAESYSRRLSRVVSQGMRETALKGFSTGGNLSLGLKIVDHKVELDERTAPAIRYCYESRAEGIAKTPIARELNARGYRTKTGKLFTVNTVTQILANPVYKGENNYMGIERSCPATVSVDLWERVQEIERREKKSRGRKASAADYVLVGKLFCGHCGATMIGDCGTSKTGEKHLYYTCTTRKRKHTCKKKSEKKDFLEWYVCEQTVTSVLSDESIQRISKRVVDVSEQELGGDTLSGCEKQLAQIERELDAAADALIKTNSQAMINRINERVSILEAQQHAAQEELARLRIQQSLRVTESDVETFLRGFCNGDLFDEDFRRRLINTFVNCVYLFDDKIVIYYNIHGIKSANHIEMLADLEQIADTPTGSDCSRDGSPKSRRYCIAVPP